MSMELVRPSSCFELTPAALAISSSPETCALNAPADNAACAVFSSRVSLLMPPVISAAETALPMLLAMASPCSLATCLAWFRSVSNAE